MKNLSTKNKLFILPALFVSLIFIGGITYYQFNDYVNNKTQSSFDAQDIVQDLLKARISVYQYLRNSNEETLNIVLKNFTHISEEQEELAMNLNNIPELVSILDAGRKHSNEYVENFKLLHSAKMKINNSSEVNTILAKLVDIGGKLEKDIELVNKELLILKNISIDNMNKILLIIIFIGVLLFVALSMLISKNILNSLEEFKNGLDSFFDYLNRKKTDITPLYDEGKNEFSLMAKNINSNITSIKSGLDKDIVCVEEVLSIIEKVNKGNLDLSIQNQASNPQLIQLCQGFNDLINGLKTNIDSVNFVLNEYSDHKFISKIELKEQEGDVATLIQNVNFITDEMSKLLKNSYNIGLTLGDSSNILIKNVDSLNKSSTEAAASLEETAAALEEITSTIINNSSNTALVGEYARSLSSTAKEGKTLAQNTSKAMDEITSQVNSINEAITVIDQIAFQTNILSLNAAVEAATAGEAGKGFAVVAQEVRNLASRSAEAAKKIKSLVEHANEKTHEGNSISKEMIEGYENLFEQVNKSTDKIEEIAVASKEQEEAITQINDAVTGLDQQTQQNAAIATQTYDIAKDTDMIAKEMISDVEAKEFLGKNEASKRTAIKQEDKATTISSNTSRKDKTLLSKSKSANEVMYEQQDENEWQSF